MLAPRLLTRDAAAEYCGVCAATLDKWVREGFLPGPVGGKRRFDRKAIDRALDQHSNLNSTGQGDLSAYERRQARKRQSDGSS